MITPCPTVRGQPGRQHPHVLDTGEPPSRPVSSGHYSYSSRCRSRANTSSIKSAPVHLPSISPPATRQVAARFASRGKLPCASCPLPPPSAWEAGPLPYPLTFSVPPFSPAPAPPTPAHPTCVRCRRALAVSAHPHSRRAPGGARRSRLPAPYSPSPPAEADTAPALLATVPPGRPSPLPPQAVPPPPAGGNPAVAAGTWREARGETAV